MSKSCGNCRFAVMEDYGYSNYTVEGTTFNCAKRLHPDGDFDRFYGDEPKLKYAESCEGFTEGDPVDIDCDREFVNGLTPEQSVIYKMHCEAA